jgi:peroxiredoxin
LLPTAPPGWSFSSTCSVFGESKVESNKNFSGSGIRWGEKKPLRDWLRVLISSEGGGLNRNGTKIRNYRWNRREKLYLFVWIGILLLFVSTPVRAQEDHWEALGVNRFEGVPPPDFTLPSLNGKSITLSELKGKVVLINFWATWCPPCKLEMPSMERVYRKFKHNGFTILAVDIMEKPETVKKFAREYKLSFPILLDATGEVSAKYMANAIPTSYIVDKKGNAVGRVLGPREWDNEHAEALLKELLGE